MVRARYSARLDTVTAFRLRSSQTLRAHRPCGAGLVAKRSEADRPGGRHCGDRGDAHCSTDLPPASRRTRRRCLPLAVNPREETSMSTEPQSANPVAQPANPYLDDALQSVRLRELDALRDAADQTMAAQIVRYADD